MTKYERLKPGHEGPEVCSTHQLVNYPELVAKIDAEKLRQEAEPGTPRSMATAQPCSSTRNAWHIFIPTKGRMKTIRKKARQAEERRTT